METEGYFHIRPMNTAHRCWIRTPQPHCLQTDQRIKRFCRNPRIHPTSNFYRLFCNGEFCFSGLAHDTDLTRNQLQDGKQSLSTFKSTNSPSLAYMAYGTLDRKRLCGSIRGSTTDMMRSITRLSDD